MKTVLLLLTVAFSFMAEPATSIDKIDKRIVNGEIADVNEYPWLVSMVVHPSDGSESHMCGGIILQPNWVLTAAHCVCVQHATVINQLLYKFATVRIGEHDYNRTDESRHHDVKIKRIIKHSKYNKNIMNDIALIELEQSMEPPVDVRYFLTDDVKFPSVKDEECYLAGWGRIDRYSTKGTTILMEMKHKIAESYNCIMKIIDRNPRLLSTDEKKQLAKEHHNLDYYNDDKQICLGTGDLSRNQQIACQGDSGGPLLCKENNKWILAGLVSYGAGLGEDHTGRNQSCVDYEVFTRVSGFMKWIRQYVDL